MTASAAEVAEVAGERPPRGPPGHTPAVERHDFGAAVRHLRESTDPTAVGLPVGPRRVTGLRREELGALAGMSADYVRRLEQLSLIHI